MQRLSQPEGLDLQLSSMQRSRSQSSDRTPISTSSSLASPPLVAPDPAYIAASAASQIVFSDHQNQVDSWFEDNGGHNDADTVVVSPSSLLLVNSFLDQLLFSILACARSTSIISLRPAVSEVLKPRLAKEAILGADDELREFLVGGDNEELSAFHNGQESRGKWDLNLVWRRTRLRCMVYTRLGDMEEDDEEMFIERERLEDATEDHRRLSRELGIISPAAAIFLTSILEFVGEHALMIAGEAAYNRRDIRPLHQEDELSTDAGDCKRVVVEDTDIEKIAFNTTLGRLWRSWKKRVRASSVSHTRPLSRDLVRRRTASSSASPSVSEVDEPIHDVDPIQRSSVAEVLQEEQEPSASVEPSDNGQNHSRGIVIGLAETTSGRATVIKGSSENRRRSMMVYSQPLVFLPLTNLPGTDSAIHATYPGSQLTRSKWHQRSSSLPTPEAPSSLSPLSETWFTPRESDNIVPSPNQNRAQGPRNVTTLDATPDTIAESVIVSQVSNQNLEKSVEVDAKTPPQEITQPVGGAGHRASNRKIRGVDAAAPSYHVKALDSPKDDDGEGNGHVQTFHYPVSASYEARPGGYPVLTKTAEGTVSDSNDSEKLDSEYPARYPSSVYGNAMVRGREEQRDVGLNSLDDVARAGLPTTQGQQLRVLDRMAPGNGNTGRGKQQASFVYGIASIPRSDPDYKDSGLSSPSPEVRLTPTKAASHLCGVEHGAPPLTPLRELMEAAHDTSDDSSSLAPSHDASKPGTGVSLDPIHNDSPSPNFQNSPDFSPGKSSSRGSRVSDLRKELPLVNTTGKERAAVQRITPSPVLVREALGHLARNSTSSSRPHTSISGTSQLSHKLKTLIGRDSTEGNRQQLSRRRSSEGSGSTIDTQSIKSPRFDKQRSFEQLIKSDETIQYTLTPKNMRDMESTNPSGTKASLPLENASETPGEGELGDVESARSGKGRIVVIKGLNGLRSNPQVSSKRHGSASGSLPSPPLVEEPEQGLFVSASGRSGLVAPRDANGKKETSTDFAEFLRSSRPGLEPRSSAMAVKYPGQVKRPNKDMISVLQTSSAPDQPDSKKITKPQLPVALRAVNAASKLEPRGARATYDDQSSDLIDFIRQGPMHDRGDGIHRIPRVVAPFRTTMDSDEIQALGTGKGKSPRDASSSAASTQDSSAPAKSAYSPATSATALIDATSTSTVRANLSASVATNAPRSDEPPHPARKQRRNKDPYPLDSDDEEDDELAITPQPRREEESLLDFLRSVTPPPRPIIPSAFGGIPKPGAKSGRTENDGPSIREPLGQNRFSPSSTKASSSRPAQRPRSNPSSIRPKNGDPQLLSLTPRDAPSHLATQVGSKVDLGRSIQPACPAPINRERNGPRRAIQPRGQRDHDTGISELADFLRNSGPPSPPLVKSLPKPRYVKEESGFSKIFSRRKRLAGRA